MRKGAWYPSVGTALAGVVLWSCSITSPDVDTRGTIQRATLDEGCWAILTDSEVYEPVNLEAEFRVDGLTVQFQGDREYHYKSVCMVGTPIKLTKIERVGGQ